MKRLKKIVAIGLLVLAFGSSTFAGTRYEGYTTVVGKVNGSGYSLNQEKKYTGQAGNLRSSSVGGKYVVDARMMLASGKSKGAWIRNVNDGTNSALPATKAMTAGSLVKVQFSNDITTPVNVQVIGKWRSN